MPLACHHLKDAMKATTKELRFEPADNKRLANLCGPLDANLRQIEAALDLAIARRGTRVKLTGSAENVERGASLLEQFYAQAERPIELDDVQLGVIDSRNPGLADEDLPRLMTRRRDLAGRTPNQRDYLEKYRWSRASSDWISVC